MKVLKTIPFLRIMMPFVGGILLGVLMELPFINWPVLLLLVGVVTILQIVTVFKSKLFVLIVSDLFLLVYGSNLVYLANTSLQESCYVHAVQKDPTSTFIGVIDDLPVTKQSFIKCPLQILEIKTKQGYQKVSGNCIAYFKRCPGDSVLKAGKTLLLKARFVAVAGPQNPLAFNYKAYLYNRQVYHTVFAGPGAYRVLDVRGNMLNGLWQLGLTCKQFLLNRLKNSQLNENSYAVCCALLTGYDDEIDKSVMDAFSHSGTLHVLSVSGLHTGLIYLVLSFIFDLVDKQKKYKLSRFLVITLLLWLFALVTGFSAPVLRAVIMFSLFGLGKLYFRNSSANQLNILLVSAFILLSYNPFYITDVGFLLSYFALAGLICFQPGLSAVWRPQNTVVNSVWQSTTASVAATISTLPFTLFYFKQFPIWFFLCNIFVIPATFVILLLALLVVVKLGLAAIAVNYLVLLMTAFIALFNSNVYGFVDAVDFSLVDSLFLTLLIVLFAIAVQYRSYVYLRSALVILIFWQLTALRFSFIAKQQSLFTLYAIKNKSVTTVKNKSVVYMSAIDTVNYNYHVKPHLISFNNPDIRLNSKLNFLKSCGEVVLMLTKPGWLPKTDVATVNILVLCNNFKLRSEDLARFKNLKLLVADASNNIYVNKKTEALCSEMKIGFYDVRKRGAYLLEL